MSGKTILIAGTIVEHEKVIGGVPTWKRIPRVTEIGSIGDQADPKENTTLADKHKTYGDGLQDSADKNLKGQYIPPKTSGEDGYDDYLLQQEFIKRCRAKEEFNVRVIWPDGEVNGFLYKSLGFEFDQGTQEDWKMWTTNGKQNSITVFGLTLSGDNTISVGGTSTLTLTADPADVDLTADDIYWSTSASGVATVVDGIVIGVSAGVATITATFRGVSTDIEVTVS